MKPKNENITISELGEQREFVSGSKYWFIDFAILNGVKFKAGKKVSWKNPDENNKVYRGKIEWLIIIDNGNVEVSIDAPLGRLPIEELYNIK